MDSKPASGSANPVTRRAFLQFGTAAVAAAGAMKALGAPGQGADRSKSDPGPSNSDLDAQNPDSIFPPATDGGGLPVFKYPFSFSNKRQYPGGWSREVTARELPIAKSVAGVNMRLTAGGVRELHWHTAAEWAIMLYGSARITAVDPEGKSFVSDVSKGDLWYFPTGIPHSIQGLGPDGAEFLLVFDDGNFSEFATVLLSDSMAHAPHEILLKNFSVGDHAFDRLPRRGRFIFQAAAPGPLEKDQTEAAGSLGKSDAGYSFAAADLPLVKRTTAGEVRIVDSRTFKASTTVAAALVTLRPGGLRELHWHPNADEWQYFIRGKGRMTVLATGGRARTMDFEAGDVGYVEQTLLHYVENRGDEDLVFLEMFKSGHYQDLSLSEWLSHTPPELVMAHLNIDQATFDAISKDKPVVIGPRQPGSAA